MARDVAQAALDVGFDGEVEQPLQLSFYLSFGIPRISPIMIVRSGSIARPDTKASFKPSVTVILSGVLDASRGALSSSGAS
jgi:hypothetical protein